MLNIFIAGVIWGTIGIFVKELNALGANSSFICFLRMFSAFVIMSCVAFMKHGNKIFCLIHDTKALISCALLGFVSNGLFNVFYTTTIKLNGMGIASVLMYTAPVFTAIASGLLFHEKFNRIKIIALMLNILGCILTVNPFASGEVSQNLGIGSQIIGILAGLGAGFCYGMAAIFGKAANERTDPFIVSVYSYFFAVMFLLIFSRPEFNFDSKILGVGFLYGLIPTSTAYIFYYNGLKKVKDTSIVPIVASIEPVMAVLIGVTLYNEKINFVNLLGVAIVLLSIGMNYLQYKPKKSPQS